MPRRRSILCLGSPRGLRRLVLQRILSKVRVLQAIEDLAALPIQRFAHGFLLGRAFALHHNITVYDGLYVALAEALRAPLVTRDRALASVPGHRAKAVSYTHLTLPTNRE